MIWKGPDGRSRYSLHPRSYYDAGVRGEPRYRILTEASWEWLDELVPCDEEALAFQRSLNTLIKLASVSQ